VILREVVAVHVRIPLATPYVFARGAMTAFDSVIVRMRTDDGLEGFGESAPLFPYGDAAAFARAINGPVAARLIGQEPYDVQRLVGAALAATNHDLDIVAGIDLALWDVLGKHYGEPAYNLLGGLCQDRVQVDYTLSTATPEEMAAYAKRVSSEGFAGVVVKVLGKSLDDDVRRVKAVRAALPGDHTVRVDCNASMTRDVALAFLRAIADLDIEFVEQPLPADDLEGAARCREIGIPISLDESLVTMEDALRILRAGAADVMNIKVPKAGGLLLAKQQAAIAAAAGLPVIVGGRTTLDLSRYASRHFAASTWPTTNRKHEGPGPASQSLVDDVATQRTTRAWVTRDGGAIKMDRQPGFGAEVDWAKVERYAVK